MDMTLGNSNKTLAFALTMLFALASCQEGTDQDNNLLQAEAYLDVAELYRNQGQFRASLIEAQNALQLVPGHQQTLTFLGRVYLDLGDFEQAREFLENLQEQLPEDDEVRLLLAEANLRLGSVQQVITLLENREMQDPGDRNQQYWLLGNSYAANEDLAAGELAFNEVLGNDQNHVQALISMSQLNYVDGDLGQSQVFLNQAIAADSGDLDLWIWRGQHALLQEDYAASEQAFLEALEIMGNYDTMTAKRFDVLRTILVPLQMQQKNEEALRYSQIIAETPQGQFQSSLDNAFTQFQQGNYQEVEAQLGEILAAAPDNPSTNMLLGMTQYAQGDYQSAQESLSTLVNSENSSAQAVKGLAASYLRLGQIDRALSLLSEARETYPDDGSLLAMIGIAQQVNGNPEAAVELLNEAVELQPGVADIHYALAGIYFLRQEMELSIAQLDEVLAINPEHVPAKSTLVEVYLSQENFTAARAALQTWLNASPESLANNNLAGRVAYVEGNYLEARQMFEVSLNLDPNDVSARLYLARIDILNEMYPQAAEMLTTVLEIEPGNAEALSGILTIARAGNSTAAREAEIIQHVENYPGEFAPPLILAQYYLTGEDLERAEEFAQIALNRNRNSFTESTMLEIYLRQIYQARLAEELNTADVLLQQAQALASDNVQVLTSAAGVAVQRGDYEQAQATIDRIKELAPQSPFGFELQGDLESGRNDSEAAIAAYAEGWALAITPSLGVKYHQALANEGMEVEADRLLSEWLAELPQDGAANLLAGVDRQTDGEDTAAIDHYEVAIQSQPNNIVLLNNLAWLYQDSNPERALELATQAAELYPDNPNVLDTYGWILYKQNQVEAAIENLQRALELAPESESIAEHLETASQ